MDVNLSKLWELVEDRGAWFPAVHRVAKSQTRLSDWTTTAALSPSGGQGFCFTPHCLYFSRCCVVCIIFLLWFDALENGFWVSLNSGSNMSLVFDLKQIFSPISSLLDNWGQEIHTWGSEVLVSRQYCGWQTPGIQSMPTILFWIHLVTTPCQYQDDFQ